MIKLTMRLLAVALLFAVPQAASAQTPPPSQPASAPAQQLLTAGQLDALVAPIALYPDALLSEVLMASTYPLEVVEADRWVGANKNLQGDALKAALDKQNWDDSMKSLTATPDVLDMMSNKLDWTQQLGDAVLAQQPDVMDAIQRLRTKAQANNKLQSTSQQTVTTQQQGGRQYIYIAPTDPDEIYVPYYDPSVVYGDVAVSGLSGLLLAAAGLYRRRDSRDRAGVRHRLCARALGVGRQSLGRRLQLGRQQHQRQPLGQRQQSTATTGRTIRRTAATCGYNNPGVAAKFGGNNAGAAII